MPGSETIPSFSPEASQIAFSWNGKKGENSDIYVKLVGENGALRLTSNPRPEFSPAWSPDGRYIAFCRDEQDTSEIVRIPALGGPERVIAQLPKREATGNNGRPLTWIEGAGPDDRLLAWFPDGKFLAFLGRRVQDGPVVIFRLSANTGEIQALTFPPDRSGGDFCPAVSPDGHRLAFGRHSSRFDPPHPYLYVVALTEAKAPTGEPQRLTTQEDDIGAGLAWTSDSRRLVFASRGGLWTLSA